MTTGKKMSIDCSDANYTILSHIKETTKTPYGKIINSLINNFCDLPEDIGNDLIEFCKYKINMYFDCANEANEPERSELLKKINIYQDIIAFLNHGNKIQIDEIRRELKMTTIPIKSGIVLFPKDWVVINPEKASQCKYAGVVECIHAKHQGIPYFLFFSNAKYSCDYTNQEIESINSLCIKKSQQFARELNYQNTFMAESKRIRECLAAKYHLSIPIVRYLHLYEHGDPHYPINYHPPYGAMIIRNH